MSNWRKIKQAFAAGAIAILIGLVHMQVASAQIPPDRQSLDDAWWTGPMLAPSAATLPRGHFLIEPYVYDVITTARFDRDGARRSTSHSNGFGSLTYINYGLADKLTVGLIPTFGYNRVTDGPSSSGIGMGDITLQAQYRLTKFHEGGWIPTMSFAVQESLPSGKYDRLGDRPSDGLGSGAYTSTLAFYSQTYFRLPNRRILRMRMNISESLSSDVNVEGVSVYGTGAEFRGHASPGGATFVDASWEYSLTRSWVLALDATYRYQRNTRVSGYDNPDMQIARKIRLNTGFSDAGRFCTCDRV